jgi:hypothetical protein
MTSGEESGPTQADSQTRRLWNNPSTRSSGSKRRRGRQPTQEYLGRRRRPPDESVYQRFGWALGADRSSLKGLPRTAARQAGNDKDSHTDKVEDTSKDEVIRSVIVQTPVGKSAGFVFFPYFSSAKYFGDANEIIREVNMMDRCFQEGLTVKKWRKTLTNGHTTVWTW